MGEGTQTTLLLQIPTVTVRTYHSLLGMDSFRPRNRRSGDTSESTTLGWISFLFIVVTKKEETFGSSGTKKGKRKNEGRSDVHRG